MWLPWGLAAGRKKNRQAESLTYFGAEFTAGVVAIGNPGRCIGNPGRCIGNPRRCRWAILLWPFRPGHGMHHDNASTSGWNGRIGPHFSNAIYTLAGLPRARDVKPWPGLRTAIGRKWERIEIHAPERKKAQFSAMSKECRGNSKTRGAVAVLQVASVAEWGQAQQELHPPGARHTLSTILPKTSFDSRRARAGRTSSKGNTESTIGRTSERSSHGTTWEANR
jgi:hypothetical protein